MEDLNTCQSKAVTQCFITNKRLAPRATAWPLQHWHRICCWATNWNQIKSTVTLIYQLTLLYRTDTLFICSKKQKINLTRSPVTSKAMQTWCGPSWKVSEIVDCVYWFKPVLRCFLLLSNSETLLQQPWSKVCPKMTQQTGAPSTSGFRKHRSVNTESTACPCPTQDLSSPSSSLVIVYLLAAAEL